MGRPTGSFLQRAANGQRGGIDGWSWVVQQVVDELSGGLVGFSGSGGVDVECHGWAGMTEASGDGAHVGTIRDEMCGRSMAEVMKTDTVESVGIREGAPRSDCG